MYDKFMCYCDGNTGEMQKSVEEAAQRITELKAKLESSIAEGPARRGAHPAQA